MFVSTKNPDMEIKMKKKTKMDRVLDQDYYEGKKKIKVAKLPVCLPNVSFLWTLIGPPRSGKSTYIESLITAPVVNGKRESYLELFDEIVFFTPQISDFENAELNKLEHVYTELTLQNLESVEELCEEVYEDGGNTLIIFDDMGADFRLSRAVQVKLEKICFNHRHMGASIFFSAQTYVSLSPAMRKSARIMTVFAVDVTSERDAIFNDLPIRKDQHQALYDHVFENPDDKKKCDGLGRCLRHTLYIDKSKTRQNKILFYKDFDEIIPK